MIPFHPSAAAVDYDEPFLDHHRYVVYAEKVRYLPVIAAIEDDYVGLLARLDRA